MFLPKLRSSTYNPIYDFRTEIRSPMIDPTAMAYIVLITRDKSNNENRTIGYACINLFIDRFLKT